MMDPAYCGRYAARCCRPNSQWDIAHRARAWWICM